MYRLRMVVLLTLVSLTSGLITGRPFFYHLAYLFVALMLFAFLWAWTGISWVHLRRQTRARRAQVGRPLEERFAVRNGSVFPKLWLEVRDGSDLPGQQDVLFEPGAAGQSDLGAEDIVLADGARVADLHHVVELGSATDAGFADRRAVDRR